MKYKASSAKKADETAPKYAHEPSDAPVRHGHEELDKGSLPGFALLFLEKPGSTSGPVKNIRPVQWSGYFYGLLLISCFIVTPFLGCLTPAHSTAQRDPSVQMLGQSPVSEWDAPSEPEFLKAKPKRKLLAPIVDFFKRDTEEDYILVGKPVSFAPEKNSQWDPPEEPVNPTAASDATQPQTPLRKTFVETPPTAPEKPAAAGPGRKIAALSSDTSGIAKLVAELNTFENIDVARAETLLAELRKIDPKNIHPDFYQYAIDRVRSDLVPLPEPVEEKTASNAADDLSQALAASSQKRKTKPRNTVSNNSRSNEVEKSISPPVNIVEKQAAPTPASAEKAVRETETAKDGEYDLASWNSLRQSPRTEIPVGRFVEPESESAPLNRRGEFIRPPQVNPEGYDSRETFGDYRQSEPGFVNPKPKYGSNYGGEWEQAMSLAIEALKNRIAQPPGSGTAAADQVRLRLLETVLYGGYDSARNSHVYLPGCDETAQNFLTNECFALATLLDERSSSEMMDRLQASQPHFQEAQRQLGKACPLKIRNLQFIQNSSPDNPQPGDFHGFGVYTPIKAEFKTNDWAWVYLEMENFVVNGNDAVGFNTKFSVSYEILDASGNFVTKKSMPSLEETAKSPRRDMALTVPLDLLSIVPGHYYAVIRVIDQNHVRLQMDSQRIDFIVRATTPDAKQ